MTALLPLPPPFQIKSDPGPPPRKPSLIFTARYTRYDPPLPLALMPSHRTQRCTEYDTILVPRRDTRTLYLLQGRQPKTPENLEQLLKIAMDLIWLNEKDRRKKRILVSEDKQNGTVNSTSNSKNYHGLRVSEYTILMNWIGSIGKDQRENENRVSPSPSSSQGTTANHPDPIVFGPPSFTAGPADRAWGIWQDFLLTGMKPDVVLYTALMDTLLNAKEYTRADQIWRHMHGQEAPLHHLDGNDGCDYSSRYSSTALGEPNVQLTNMNHVMDTVSKTLSHGAKLSPVDTGRRKSTQESPSLQKDDKQHQHQHQHWQQGPRIVPNLQTFSVVMQAFVLKRDLQGVAQTYKELIQALSPSPAVATSSTPVSLPHHVNTVLLNQILRVLVDLGELDAAKEIYAKMRESTSGQKCSVRRPAWGNRYYDDDQDDQNGEDKKHHAGGCTSDAVSWPPHMTTAPVPALSNPGGSTSSTLSASLPTLTTSPLHHRSSLRRSVWETRQKWRQEFSPESTLPSSSSSSSTQLRSLSRSSLSIAPNECTHHLILQLARRKRDQELEDIALSYLEQP
ncbi:hypothetical protein EDD11_003205 [Mortierella claussenii]|nr:hypothetical protein EDD11_003205 [Mortierella claussenii]